MWYCRVQKEFAFQIASRVVSTKRVMQWSNNCTVSNILKISAVNQNGGRTYCIHSFTQGVGFVSQLIEMAAVKR